MSDWDWRGWLALTIIAAIIGWIASEIEWRIELSRHDADYKSRYGPDFYRACYIRDMVKHRRTRLLARQFRKTTEG